jgi:hypothetical protein
MKLVPIIVAPALLLISGVSHAQASPGKITYTHEQLRDSHSLTIPAIVERFASDTGRASLIHPDQFLLLLNGRRDDKAAENLNKSKTVEVLSDGSGVIINVVTKAPAGA